MNSGDPKCVQANEKRGGEHGVYGEPGSWGVDTAVWWGHGCVTDKVCGGEQRAHGGATVWMEDTK